MRIGREASAVLRNYRSDGSLFWNEVSISPIRNPSNQITHFIGTQTDVTERVNADAIR
jgi:PAS domain S-box-containing protein